ncbi:MAG: LLM class flavin-dependent oxidoreductase [Thaumarchaeota archaeon]|nr:LLM class flavin-dependent oxidoreductase [Nitrososphaerota archaeon]
MVDFGVGLAPTEPIKKVAWIARTAEVLGFKYVVHADQRFRGEKDVFVTLTADALSTEKIMLGPCISDPYSRIPGMLATAIGSLDEISGGRAVLTLGVGGSGFEELHIERKHPNTAVKESFQIIRGLLRGEEVTFKGKMFQVTKAKMNFQCRKDIPMFIASRSPMNLELAGELADGAVLASYASEPQLRYAMKKVEVGAKKGGRTLKDLKLIAWLYASISERSSEAVANVRPFVTQALLNTSPEMYPVMFEGLDAGVTSFVLDCRTAGGKQRANEDRKYLTDEVIRRFSVAGTAEECIEKLRAVAKLGIDTIWLRPFSAPFSESNHEKVIIPFAEKVIPNV